MKWFFKREKQPDEAVEKKSTGDGLLQSYFASLMSLVLCVSMFLGTSYAWFTTEVNNVGNEIYIGTLDVELEKKVKDSDTWLSLSELKDGVNANQLYNGSIRWEPGYTSLETIRVTNKGDLAFKYELCFTDEILAKDGEEEIETAAEEGVEPADESTEGGEPVVDPDAQILAAIGESFEVWVYDHQNTEEGTNPEPKSYDEIIAADSGWVRIGTLAEVLNGEAVFTGAMEKKDIIADMDGTIMQTSHEYTVALHMLESAGSSNLMGQKLSLNVRLVAYQMISETDDFGEGQSYDAVVAVSNVEELTDALENGGNIVLTNDIDLGEEDLTVREDVTVILELNGHSIIKTQTETTSSMINNSGTLTICDNVGTGKISYADTTDGIKTDEYVSCTIWNAGVLNVTGGTIENTTTAAKPEDAHYHAIYAVKGSTTNISGGVINSTGGDCIHVLSGNGGTVTTLNISGGVLTASSDWNMDVFITEPGVGTLVNISGGNFDRGVRIYAYSTMNASETGDWLSITTPSLVAPTDGGDIWTPANAE